MTSELCSLLSSSLPPASGTQPATCTSPLTTAQPHLATTLPPVIRSGGTYSRVKVLASSVSLRDWHERARGGGRHHEPVASATQRPSERSNTPSTTRPMLHKQTHAVALPKSPSRHSPVAVRNTACTYERGAALEHFRTRHTMSRADQARSNASLGRLTEPTRPCQATARACTLVACDHSFSYRLTPSRRNGRSCMNAGG